MKDESSVSSEDPSSSKATTSDGQGGSAEGSESSSSFSLVKAETRAVNRSKILVFLVILLAAGALGGLIYYLIDRDEVVAFQAQFNDFAVEIAELTHYEAKNIYTTIETFDSAITSLVLTTNATFPNVTIPYLEVQGLKTIALTQAVQMSFIPLLKENEKKQWEAYARANQDWLAQSLLWQDQVADAQGADNSGRRKLDSVASMPDKIWRYSDTGEPMVQDSNNGIDFGLATCAPVWQQVPAPRDLSILKYDLLSNPMFRRLYKGLWESRIPVLSEATNLSWLYGGAVHDDGEHPHSALLTPIYPSFKAALHERNDIVGFMVAILPWDTYFTNLLSEGSNGIHVVLHNTCDQFFTYRLDGRKAIFIGHGDLHETAYDGLEFDTKFAPFLKHNFSDAREHCEFDMRIFPTASFEASYRTNKPGLYTAVVVLIFVFTAATFLLYDYLVQRRQDKVMATAKRTNAIVSSLFPSNVRDRILKDAEEQADQDVRDNKRASIFKPGAKSKLKDFLDEGAEAEKGEVVAYDTKPIADLFPNVTVMFADIVGFTAWSSVREPSQVFTLLETLFAAFDDIAKRRRVFKVETVGDCYVAVAGLPDPRKDHAIVMARFARDVLYKMNDLTKRLETTLGPDTGELALRIGLHSGQVTAGVLRGDKSRFQLFGDTMNTASRIESSGERNKIHVSVETASLLMASAKGHWVKERTDSVSAKGKGELMTYWLDLRGQSCPSTKSGSTDTSDKDGDINESRKERPSQPLQPSKLSGGVVEEDNDAVQAAMAAKTKRLIEWNVDVLARLLKQIQARRECLKTASNKFNDPEDAFEGGSQVIDEVQEIITLPRFSKKLSKSMPNPESVELKPEVIYQLRDYVSTVASLYRDNSFHCFEHASHVTMSVVKLLSRIVAPDDKMIESDEDALASLHDHTYGITSDPLTQFACIFSALIHDVDHTGVPNVQLIKENALVAVAYKNKSIAEQNSVDIAWGLLMAPEYRELRGAIYGDATEMQRFRQLVVNSVMATDIMDKDAGSFRKARWEKAFNEQADSSDTKLESVNRKATIVIEHLIQASDVAHTMQHWHVYSKWNERLFDEMYKAYQEGRSDADPSLSWYEGEIGFFDFYIIPLAMKLKTCGVFGVSSDEYLNYAMSNRREWESRGRDRVEAMREKYIQN